MNSLLLTLILGACLMVALFGKRVSIIHPAVLFISMFFLNAFMVLIRVPSVPDLRINTVLIVSLACITFLFFSSVNIKYRSKNTKLNRLVNYISYSRLLVILFVIIDIVVILLYIRAQRNIVNRLMGNAGSLMQTMSKYSSLVKFSTEDSGMPTFIKLATEIVYASGFVFGFIQINNYVAGGKKELDKILIINVSLSFLLSLLSGSRSGAIRLLAALMTILFLLQRRVSKKRTMQSIRRVAIVSLFIILSFKAVGNLLGRGNERTLMDTIFMYMGGPIKNFDIFLNESFQRGDIIGKMTFANQYRNIANLTGNSSYLYQLAVLPYGIVNGIDLGNVYTALTSLIYDFGHATAIVMIIVMAIISRWTYSKAERQIGTKKVLWIFTYAFLTYFILMSGFAEKFFGIILSMNLYRHLIYFVVIYKGLTLKTNLSCMTRPKVARVKNIVI